MEGLPAEQVSLPGPPAVGRGTAGARRPALPSTLASGLGHMCRPIAGGKPSREVAILQGGCKCLWPLVSATPRPHAARTHTDEHKSTCKASAAQRSRDAGLPGLCRLGLTCAVPFPAVLTLRPPAPPYKACGLRGGRKAELQRAAAEIGTPSVPPLRLQVPFYEPTYRHARTASAVGHTNCAARQHAAASASIAIKNVECRCSSVQQCSPGCWRIARPLPTSKCGESGNSGHWNSMEVRCSRLSIGM